MNKDINRPKAGIIFAWEGDELHWFIVTPDLFKRIRDIIESIPSDSWAIRTEGDMVDKIYDLIFLPEEEQSRGDIYIPDILKYGFTQTWCLESTDFLNKYEFIGMTTYPSY